MGLRTAGAGSPWTFDQRCEGQDRPQGPRRVTMIGLSADDLGENADSNSCTSFLFLKDATFNRKRYAEAKQKAACPRYTAGRHQQRYGRDRLRPSEWSAPPPAPVATVSEHLRSVPLIRPRIQTFSKGMVTDRNHRTRRSSANSRRSPMPRPIRSTPKVVTAVTPSIPRCFPRRPLASWAAHAVARLLWTWNRRLRSDTAEACTLLRRKITQPLARGL
jgi:hypothetical protein